MAGIRLLLFLVVLSVVKFGLAVAQTLLATLEYSQRIHSQLRRIFSIWGYKSQLEELHKIVVTTNTMLQEAEPKSLYNKAEEYVDRLKDTLSKPSDIFYEFVPFLELKQLKGLPTKHGRLYQNIYCFFSFHDTFAPYKPSHKGKKLPKKMNAFTGIHRKSELDIDYNPFLKRREDNVAGKNDDREAIIDKFLKATDNDVANLAVAPLDENDIQDIGEASYDDVQSTETINLLGSHQSSSEHGPGDCIIDIVSEQPLNQESHHVSTPEAITNNNLLEAKDNGNCNVVVQFGENEIHDIENDEIANLMGSRGSSSEHGSNESVIDPEQQLNQVSPHVSTPENNIHRQQIYDENAILWIRLVAKKIMHIFCRFMLSKWLYRLLNVTLEVLQVSFTEENNHRKMSNSLCYKLIFITSSICFLISLVEFFMEADQSGAVWRRRGIFCWFYYPGNDGRVFGSLSLNFSVISSATQFCVNLAILAMNSKFFTADYLALLFSIVGLICPMNNHPS